MKKLLWHVPLSFFLLLLAAGPVLATDYTYATAVVEWEPGQYELPTDYLYFQNNSQLVLGPPSFNLAEAYGIGRHGILTLQMGQAFGNGPGLDLTVFEYGQSVGGANDPYDVWVSNDAQSWSFVGPSAGDLTSFDLSGIPGLLNYVRIVDADISGRYDGCDIDAVRAVVPEPATLSLLALGGLAVIRRRRK